MPAPADHLKKDLPVAMTMAAFIGIAWYICIELNIRLFMTFRRRRGLYFWSCCLCSWGVLLGPLCMLLYDFGIIKSIWAAIPPIYVTWWIMVVPQSLVLYSRLHLVMNNSKHLCWVLGMIIGTAIFISIPTIVIGLVQLDNPNLIMDRIQVTTFFLQETIISTLYVYQTRNYLKSSTILGYDDKTIRRVMQHLNYTNLLVIFLDISVLVLSYIPGIFYVQAVYKPCVYGIKLRVEFSILNKLVETVKGRSRNSSQLWHRYSTSISNRHPDSLFVETPWKQSVWYPQRPPVARTESFNCRNLPASEAQIPVIESGADPREPTSMMSMEKEGTMERADDIMQTTEIPIEPSLMQIGKSTRVSDMV